MTNKSDPASAWDEARKQLEELQKQHNKLTQQWDELDAKGDALTQRHNAEGDVFFEDEPWFGQYEQITNTQNEVLEKIDALDVKIEAVEEEIEVDEDKDHSFPVKHTCGHTDRIYVTLSQRERFVAHAEKKLCRMCRYMLAPDVTRNQEGMLRRLAAHTEVNREAGNTWFAYEEFVLHDDKKSGDWELKQLAKQGLVELQTEASTRAFRVTPAGWHFLQIEDPHQEQQ